MRRVNRSQDRRSSRGTSIFHSRRDSRFFGVDATQPPDGLPCAIDPGSLAAVAGFRVWRGTAVPRFRFDPPAVLGTRSRFFLIWFLGETLYNWLAITAHSLSSLPLFPRYVGNAGGDEWPVQPRLLKIREWLRGQGFRQVQALKAEIGGGIFLRVSIYQDAPAKVRVQVTFIPQANGAISVCYAVNSVGADGSLYLTDNLYIPFGGFSRKTGSLSANPGAVPCAVCWLIIGSASPSRGSNSSPSRMIRWLTSMPPSKSSISLTPNSAFFIRTRNAKTSASSLPRGAIGCGRKSGCLTILAAPPATSDGDAGKIPPLLPVAVGN